MIIFDDSIAKELADAIKFAACELRALREQRLIGLATKDDLTHAERRILSAIRTPVDKEVKSLTSQLAASTGQVEKAVAENQTK